MSNMTPLLEARNVGRNHPNGERWLLADISLSIRPGDRIALTGPSGSGKTLFLRALAMLDPLDQGCILWQGNPVAGEAMPLFRCQAIYLHQRSALFEETVLGALQQPFGLAVNRDRRFELSKVLGWLATLGRQEAFLEGRVRDLSGGEMQIIALVRALQLEPRVLLLDEPTSAMDAATAAAVETLLAGWMAQAPAERALVWVTHDPEQARRVGRRVAVIDGGRLREGEP